MSKRKEKRPLKWGRVVPFVVFLTGFVLVLFAAINLWMVRQNDAFARSEYDELRNSFERSIASRFEHTIVEDEPEYTDGHQALYEPPEKPDLPLAPAESEHVSDDTRIDMSFFSEINPDFVGWISIEGTSVHYPIVQGLDNNRYLGITFSGERNPAGTIFMDYRIIEGFDAPITILYGHNMRDGSMFASLLNYLEPEFMSSYPEITIVTADGTFLVYEVFRARRVTAWDSVYTLDFNDEAAVAFFETAPTDTSRVLLLSTCTGDGDRNARVLIYASLLA
ncbi:MAG: class B sortase [Oscillospiraceae bacterium]|nr:class B sortase [Oscillospiraceae bacterium]